MRGSLEAFANQATVSPGYVQNGNSAWAQRYCQDLKDVAIRYADRLPRNVQRHLGPSELGHHCDRQLVGKMAGVSFGSGAGNMLYDPWASMVGTAIHAFLEQAFSWESAQGKERGRWLAETRVCADPGSARPHPGTADLYDATTRTLTDHKGVALDTLIPTPGGWTTMNCLVQGDSVLGADGKPCRVTKTYPVQHRDCYRVVFKGGASVVTDDVQQWEVQRNKNGGQNSGSQETVLLSSAEMREQLRAANGQRHLRVRTVAVELPEADLPVNPYVLGCWLGDGEAANNVIISADDEIFEGIEACGYTLGANLDKRGYRRHTVLGIRPGLRALGVLGNKHVPDLYMRASRSQRLELLRGLMDTDGSHNKQRNQCVFTSMDKALAAQAEELAASLGWKSYTCSFQAHGFGVSTTAYQVMFTPTGANPFHLERKRALVTPKQVAGASYRIVQSVEPVPSVPTRCIDVDSSDHLYLVTEQFIPTHNCQSEAIRTRLRKDGPPFHYYVQMLLYATGFMHLGYPVDRVVLASWPRTKSTLADMYCWEKVITVADLELVVEVLRKTEVREELAVLVGAGEVSFWDIPPTPSTDDCTYCPFFNPAALGDKTAKGCPGTSLKKLVLRPVRVSPGAQVDADLGLLRVLVSPHGVLPHDALGVHVPDDDAAAVNHGDFGLRGGGEGPWREALALVPVLPVLLHLLGRRPALDLLQDLVLLLQALGSLPLVLDHARQEAHGVGHALVPFNGDGDRLGEGGDQLILLGCEVVPVEVGGTVRGHGVVVRRYRHVAHALRPAVGQGEGLVRHDVLVHWNPLFVGGVFRVEE